MAAVRVPKTGKVVLYVKTGIGTGGNPTTVTRTYSGVHNLADDDKIFDTMKILGGLYDSDIVEYVLVEQNEMINA